MWVLTYVSQVLSLRILCKFHSMPYYTRNMWERTAAAIRLHSKTKFMGPIGTQGSCNQAMHAPKSSLWTRWIIGVLSTFASLSNFQNHNIFFTKETSILGAKWGKYIRVFTLYTNLVGGVIFLIDACIGLVSLVNLTVENECITALFTVSLL